MGLQKVGHNWPTNTNRWHSVKESACQCRECKGCGFDPWMGKIPWRRKWQPTQVFLPGKVHGQMSLADCCPWGRKELDTTQWLSTHTHTQFSSDLNHIRVFSPRYSLPSIARNYLIYWKFILMQMELQREEINKKSINNQDDKRSRLCYILMN